MAVFYDTLQWRTPYPNSGTGVPSDPPPNPTTDYIQPMQINQSWNNLWLIAEVVTPDLTEYVPATDTYWKFDYWKTIVNEDFSELPAETSTGTINSGGGHKGISLVGHVGNPFPFNDIAWRYPKFDSTNPATYDYTHISLGYGGRIADMYAYDSAGTSGTRYDGVDSYPYLDLTDMLPSTIPIYTFYFGFTVRINRTEDTTGGNNEHSIRGTWQVDVHNNWTEVKNTVDAIVSA